MSVVTPFRSAVTGFAASASCRLSVTALRSFSGLRVLSASLAVCMLWSFVGAGTALAAAPKKKLGSHSPIAHAPAFPTLASPFNLLSPPKALPLQRNLSSSQTLASTVAAPSPRPASPSVSLLDEVGKLARPVSAEQVAGWKRELKTSHPAAGRAAELHIWLGEWELAQNERPVLARWHFRQAKQGVGRGQRLNGLASYDDATALYYEGAYDQAEHAFKALLSPKTVLPGYDRRTCALWQRHAAACAGYHRQHAAQGIPEPPQLDPECGAAALAASLRALRLPYDRKTVLAGCHVTGEGSNLQDLVNAGPKLGVSVQTVSADDKGLISLPKPLVAYVEQDHFISVVRADKKGVSYLCSDCGMWPGGEVELTWKQWHLLNPGVYATVTKPGSEWDHALARLPLSPSTGSPSGSRVASTGSLSGLFHSSVHLALGHVAGLRPRMVLSCGLKPISQECPSYVQCAMSCPYSPGQSGPSKGDPVNLGTGEEEYSPSPDIVVYNPHGPSVVWQRIYNSLRGENVKPYEYDDFGNGWSHPYNVGVYDPSLPGLTSGTSNTKYILLPNGSRVSFTARAVPNATPASAPTSTSSARVLCDVQPGAGYLVEWDYDASSASGHYTITLPDRSKWITTVVHQSTASPGYNEQYGISLYQLARLVDRNGKGLTFNYGPASTGYGDSGYPLLSSISDLSTGTTLLTLSRILTGQYTSSQIGQVSDAYGRSVYYQYGVFGSYLYNADVTAVSQIVPTGSTNAASQAPRYSYDYTSYGYGGENAPFLTSITVPSPTGSGTSTASIMYNPYTLMVSGLQDGNGNIHTYAYNSPGANQVTETIQNSSGNTVYTHSKGYDMHLSQTTETDGTGHALSSPVYSDPNNPYRPSQVTDGNGKTTSYTWDSFGNLLSETPPSDVTRTPAATVYHYDYSQFALGELQWMQEGFKQKTTYAYFEPSGLLQNVTMPLPGTVGGTQTAVTSYTYDGLGNTLTVTRPGNNAISSITTTLNYTTDGSYSQPAAIGQPVTVTDNLGKVTHLRYDSQGNAVGVKDALGNETDLAYTIANEPLQTVLPATGQTGSGHGGSLTGYLYAEPSSFVTAQWPAATLQYGPATTSTLYDEGNVGAIRQTTTAYGQEGETLSVTGSTEPVAYTYDALYRMKTLTDGGGHTTSYFYNAAGYLAQVVYPGAGMPSAPLAAGTADTLTYPSYDGAGNPLTRTDGNNVTTTYSYSDPESELTDITYPSGTIGAVHLTYDAYGRRSAMTDSTGGQSYTYDDEDNKLSATTIYTGRPAKTLTYAYYPDGSRQTMAITGDSYPFSYTYDGVGRLVNLIDPNEDSATWSYLDNGWLQSQAYIYAAGNVHTISNYAYNALGLLTQSQFNEPFSNGTINRGQFSNITYDGAGNRLSFSSSGLSNATEQTTYSYDNKNQVTGETSTRNGGYTNAFSYDGGSNGPGNATTFRGSSQTFNADNQLVGTGYGYDGNGNPTTYKGNALSFDPENRLTGYASTLTSAYTGDGLRAWKQTSSGRTYFIYDGDQLIREERPTGTSPENVYGPNGLVGNQSFSYGFDPQGNTTLAILGNGVPTNGGTFDAFGSNKSTGNPGSYVGFGARWGGYTDAETGLVLFTHRFYDPSNGRWLTRDPISYNGGVNIYGYVGNNPLNEDDSEGLFAPNPGPVEPPPPGVWPVLLGIGGGVIRGAGGLIIGAGGTVLATVGGVGILLLGASPAGPANEWGPNEGPNRHCPPYIQNGLNKGTKGNKGKDTTGTGANKDSGGGDDPLYKLSCEDLWTLYNQASGKEKAKLNMVLKHKGCKGSGRGGGQSK